MRRTVRDACFALVLVAQAALFAGAAAAQTKIACVGDSITADPASWCVVLREKLGSDYMVRNFGVSGTCALKSCDAPYWSTAQFKSSHDFGPNIVIIMLGTNDSKPSNWNRGKDQFAADYGALIDSYTSLATRPRVYAIIVIPAGRNSYTISGTTIANELNPIIEQVAMAKMITTIDGFAAFGGAMFDMSLFSASDQVHPYPKGHEVLGNAVYEVLMSSGGLGTGGMDAGTGGMGGTGAGTGGMDAGTGGMGATSGSAATGGTGGMGGSATGGATAGVSGASTGGAGGGAVAGAGGAGAGGGSSSVTGGSSAGSSGAGGGTSHAGGATSAEAGAGGAAAGTSALRDPEAESDGGGCRTAGSATSSGPTIVLLALLAVASSRRRALVAAAATNRSRSGLPGLRPPSRPPVP